MRVKVWKVKNLSPKPLDFDIVLGSGMRREMHLDGKVVSRGLTDEEYNSTTIQSMLEKKLLRAIPTFKILLVDTPAPAPAKVTAAPPAPKQTEVTSAPEVLKEDADDAPADEK
jgi:hypothetical protein